MHTAERLRVPDLRTLVQGFRIHHEQRRGPHRAMIASRARAGKRGRGLLLERPPERRVKEARRLERSVVAGPADDERQSVAVDVRTQ